MRVHVETTLPCDADDAWDEVQTSRLLSEVAHPLVRIAPEAGQAALPSRWTNLMTTRVRVYLFGFIPWGLRTLAFERVDGRRREIQTREHDLLVGRWDHLIRIEPLSPDCCRYTDDVELEAGLLTPLVWLFAVWFYRRRQLRWQHVAERLRASAPTPSVVMGLA